MNRFIYHLFYLVIFLFLLFLACFIILYMEKGPVLVLGRYFLWSFASLIMLVLIYIFFYVTHKMRSSMTEKENLLAHLRISREGLGVFDANRKLILANNLFNQYGNLISDENLSTIEDIINISELAPVLDFLDHKQLSRLSKHEEPYISFTIDKNGKIFMIDCVLFQDNGFEISINDVTQSEEQARLKHQLTQNIAHEFKTPVSSIQGYLEIIIEGEKSGTLPPDKLQHFLERCYAQSNRLNNLLQDISILSKMGDTSKTIDKEPIDLSLMVKNLIQDISLKLEEQEMKVEDLLPGSLLVEGNQSMVYSIFRNLMDNAISYAGKGTTITINRFRTDDTYHYFSFSDNGIGVEERHLNRLFERFYRIDKGRSRKLGGTGLGLAIVKNAVNLHGGTISARNRVGGGLEFIFTLRK